MKCGLLFFALLLITSCRSTTALNASEGLNPFTSDGCSMSPNGPRENPHAFLECCVQHDLAYWQGGTSAAKEQADRALKSCVTENSDESIGNLYWQGVRLGGGPQFKTPFRWGYGWTYYQGYTELTPQQKRAVGKEIKLIQWDHIYSPLKQD